MEKKATLSNLIQLWNLYFPSKTEEPTPVITQQCTVLFTQRLSFALIAPVFSHHQHVDQQIATLMKKKKKEYHFPPVCSLMILMVEFDYHPSLVYYQALKFTSVGTMLSAKRSAARFHLLQPGWCYPPLVSLNNTHSCQQCQAAATKGCPRCSRFSSSRSSAHARCRQTSSDWTCCTTTEENLEATVSGHQPQALHGDGFFCLWAELSWAGLVSNLLL